MHVGMYIIFYLGTPYHNQVLMVYINISMMKNLFRHV